MKIQDINVDGQQVRVAVRAGAADGVPLLLINGIGASLEVLEPFVNALDPALTVIRFDVPGTGGSPLPRRPYRFGGLCKLIAALLSQLGHETVDVLGISWGGGVAQPDSRLHVFSGGHLGLVTEAGQLAPVVERFLRPAGARGERPRRFRYWPAALNVRAPRNTRRSFAPSPAAYAGRPGVR